MKRFLQLLILIGTFFLCYWIASPLIGEIYLSMGDAYLKEQYPYVALDYYQKGLSYDRLNPRLYTQLGLLYLNISKRTKDSPRDMNMVEKGLTLFKKAISLTGDPRLDYNIGMAYELNGNQEMAKYYFKRAFNKSNGKVGRR